MVSVVPGGLNCRGPRFSCARVAKVKPGQFASVEKLPPRFVMLPVQLEPPMVLAMMEFLTCRKPDSLVCSAAPLPTSLSATVTKLSHAVPVITRMAPPPLTAVFCASVLLIIRVFESLPDIEMAPPKLALFPTKALLRISVSELAASTAPPLAAELS